MAVIPLTLPDPSCSLQQWVEIYRARSGVSHPRYTQIERAGSVLRLSRLTLDFVKASLAEGVETSSRKHIDTADSAPRQTMCPALQKIH